jgi:dihydrofolate synthase/folylpolyglutamate synthase
MFSRIGSAALKNNLDNTLKLMEFLENPHTKFKSIHIAGTNGKGSVSHMLASVFQSAGYKTGLYTSPHLKDFRERIRINGEMIKEKDVLDMTLKMTTIIEDIEPSFFEATVAMAFEYFSKNEVDIAIIETGLGGRLDSTNVIIPELSIITNIGYDHMNVLGNTLIEIASEKAGIIKNEVPVVVGRKDEATKEIFLNKTLETKSSLAFSADVYDSEIKDISPDMISLQLRNKITSEVYNVQCDLPGIYQKENITTVATAVDLLNEVGWKLTRSDMLNGLMKTKKNTSLFGRWDVLQKKPMIVLDVAHNEDGFLILVDHLSKFKFNQMHFVLGFSKDKEFSKILNMLPLNARFYFTSANSPRALEHNTLQEIAATKDVIGESFTNVNEAITYALKNADEQDIIIVSGSIYVVGDVNRELFC